MAKKKKQYKYSVLSFGFNGYERLHEPAYIDPDAEYVYVTDDKNMKSDTWKIVVDDSLDGMGKWEKLWYVRYNPFRYCSTDICIRIDGSCQPDRYLPQIADEFEKGGYDTGLMVGGYVDNVEDDYKVWCAVRDYPREFADKNLEFFRSCGYDTKSKDHVGLTMSIHRKTYNDECLRSMVYSLTKILGMNQGIGDCDRLDEPIYTFVVSHYFRNGNFMLFDSTVFKSGAVNLYAHNSENRVYPTWCRTILYPVLFNAPCRAVRFGDMRRDNAQYKNSDCLYVVYYHNEHDNAEKWCRRLESEGVDYVLMDSGSNNPVNGVNSIVTENIYYGGLWHNTRDLCLSLGKKWVFIVDDDILVDDENFRLLMDRTSNIMERNTNIGVYQPSSTDDSRNLYKRNICQHTGGIRPVPAMEGWLMLFRTDIFNEIDKLGINYRVDLSMGWGLDILTLYCSYLLGYSNALDDCVVVKHPMGPGKYDENKANLQMNAMFKFLGFDYFKMEAVVGGRVEPRQIILDQPK